MYTLNITISRLRKRVLPIILSFEVHYNWGYYAKRVKIAHYRYLSSQKHEKWSLNNEYPPKYLSLLRRDLKQNPDNTEEVCFTRIHSTRHAQSRR